MIAAFQFLTVLPLPVKTGRENLEKSMVWFPVVGVVIGLVTGFGYRLLTYVFVETVSAALTIFIYIVLTRGLHLDGFMDTIDGFFSSKDRKSMMEIMKEPAVGSFAVLGVGVWFLVLFTSIPFLRPVDFVMIHTLTRFQVLLLPLLFSYPRENGTGKFFAASVTLKTFIGALIFTIIVMAAMYFIDISFLPIFSAFLLISLVISWFIGLWSKKKISGITGDVIGFTIETTHLVLVLFIPLVKNLCKSV